MAVPPSSTDQPGPTIQFSRRTTYGRPTAEAEESPRAAHRCCYYAVPLKCNETDSPDQHRWMCNHPSKWRAEGRGEQSLDALDGPRVVLAIPDDPRAAVRLLWRGSVDTRLHSLCRM